MGMVSVVLQLLTHGRADTLPALFESLVAQTDQNWELKLLINGASDRVREQILQVTRPYASRLRMSIDVSQENLGFAGGHQWLFERHVSPFVLLVNDDVVVGENYLSTLRRYLDEHSDVGAVTGKLVRPDGMIDSLGLSLAASGRVSNIAEGRRDRVALAESYEVFGVAGTLPLIRREAVIQASHDGRLFDPAFGSYKEDVELAFRFRHQGWKSVVIPSTSAIHHRTFRRSRLHRGVSFYAASHSYRNHLWNLLTFYTWKEYLSVSWALIPFEFFKFVFLLCTNPGVLVWTLTTTRLHWKELMAKRAHFV